MSDKLTQADLDELRRVWRRSQKVIKKRKEMYPDDADIQAETLERLVGDYGLPHICDWNKAVTRIVPKLLAELEFMKQVICGMADDGKDAYTVMEMRRALEFIADYNVTGRNVTQAAHQMQTEALRVLTTDLQATGSRMLNFKEVLK